VQLALNNIREKIQIKVEKMDTDNDIFLSAKNYLVGLSLYGGKFIAAQATMDNVLTSLASSSSSDRKSEGQKS
jgi:hypothetical protein